MVQDVETHGFAADRDSIFILVGAVGWDMDSAFVQLDWDSDVATLTVDRPDALNALNVDAPR